MIAQLTLHTANSAQALGALPLEDLVGLYEMVLQELEEINRRRKQVTHEG